MLARGLHAELRRVHAVATNLVGVCACVLVTYNDSFVHEKACIGLEKKVFVEDTANTLPSHFDV